MIQFYPAAKWVPGPPAKVWPEVNTVAGIILHSAEGYEAGMRSRLAEPALNPDGTENKRAVSWPFSIYKDGRVEQHYPLSASCWHAGGHANNTRFVGVEHEGIVGEPLTAPQLAASVTLTRWVAQQGGWALQRAAGPAQTLREHREVWAGTTCPNGRIPWGYYVPEAPVPGGLTKLTNQEGIAAFMLAVQQFSLALAQQDGRYVGRLEGAPNGYEDVVLRVKVG